LKSGWFPGSPNFPTPPRMMLESPTEDAGPHTHHGRPFPSQPRRNSATHRFTRALIWAREGSFRPP